MFPFENNIACAPHPTTDEESANIRQRKSQVIDDVPAGKVDQLSRKERKAQRNRWSDAMHRGYDGILGGNLVVDALGRRWARAREPVYRDPREDCIGYQWQSR
jgi:hypothetical protein